MKSIRINPIGYIKRKSTDENDKDRSLISKIIINKNLTDALAGIDDFSHIYIIFWMNKIKNTGFLHHPGKIHETKPVGIFATRAPIHTNPIGLTLVRLIKREKNILWVKGLDAYDDTPVLDIKPYPDWENGVCIVVTDFMIPDWIKKGSPRRIE
jgi:tRNA-Thr(GGU) m(6)t(6)A37 methyltransferase TsaA